MEVAFLGSGTYCCWTTMARVTTEDCLARVGNHFALVLLAAQRARQLNSGQAPLVTCTNRAAVTSLREIALGRVSSNQSVEVALKEHLADQRGLEHARKSFQRGRG
jgi:DNA-directed RNA polymerase subunit omega